MLKFCNFLRKDDIGEPPWGGFCVEWSRPIAFQGRELEVTGNPLERSKMQVVIIYGE